MGGFTREDKAKEEIGQMVIDLWNKDGDFRCPLERMEKTADMICGTFCRKDCIMSSICDAVPIT